MQPIRCLPVSETYKDDAGDNPDCAHQSRQADDRSEMTMMPKHRGLGADSGLQTPALKNL